VESSVGVQTSCFVAMAIDCVLDWFVTRPPPGQTAVEFLWFLTNLVFPNMHAVDTGRVWNEHPYQCNLDL